MPKSLYHFAFIFVLVCLQNENSLSQSRFGTELNNSVISALSSRNNILYRGIDNYLQISPLFQSKYDTLIVKCNNGSVFFEKENVLFVMPERLGKVRLMIYGITGKDTVSLGYTYFEVKAVPEPCLTINNTPLSTHCTMPKKILQNCDSLGIYFSKDIVGSENWLKVTGFILVYNYGGFRISYNNPSKIFSKAIKQILNHLGPDREIGILPIVEGEGSLTKKLPIYRITIY
jgi:GldM C-terminal domain